MNNEQLKLAEDRIPDNDNTVALARGRSAPEIPAYLQETYWWAYLHENALWFFEREWVVNLILWGNMKRLTEQVLDETQLKPRSRVLQLACVYGDFTNRLADRLAQSGSRLDLVDVAPIQLRNARRKLAEQRNISFQHQDSSALYYPDASFDQTVVFFLLHEQPADVRRGTVREALRVTRPGGKIIFVDYHGPRRSNPLRYVMKPILTMLEPFAMDLWDSDLKSWLPADVPLQEAQTETMFGGLYQKMVVTR